MGTSAIVIYILLGLAVFKWFHWRWSTRHLNRFFKQFAGPKRIVTFWTVNIILYKNYTLKYFTDLFGEFKENTLCWWLGPVPTMLTTDPEIIKQVMLLPELQNKSTMYNPIKKFVRGGLVFISDKAWQRHRKFLNPCFHVSLLMKFIGTFNTAKNVAISELNALADGRYHKIDELMIYISMKTTLDASFEIELPKKDVYKISKLIADIIKDAIWRSILGFMHLGFISSLDVRVNSHLKYLRHTMRKIVEKRMIAKNHNDFSLTEDPQESIESKKKSPKILLNQCVELYKTNEFTIEDAITECLMLLGASFDTTGITMYSVMVMLAMHPDVQQRVYEEVVSVFPDKDFKMENEHLRELPYLDMVIKETMRLLPPIVHIGRDVRKDTPISEDITLPKGLQVMISIFHLHRRKDLWGPDADAFNPERFVPDSFANIHPYAYIPFSKGARNCIGWRYGEIMLAIVMSGLIRNFKFETNQKYEHLEFESGIAIGYKDPPLLRFERRP